MNINKAIARALNKRRLRIRKNVSGSAERPRLSVFRSECHIYGQLIDDEAGTTLLACSSMSKDIKGTLNDKSPTEVATAIGEALAEKAKAAGISQVSYDRGGRRYAGRVAAFADGARSKGLQF